MSPTTVDKKKWSKLSANQRGLWFTYQKAPHLRAGFNLAFCPRILGDVDPALVRHTLNVLMARYPILRATFSNSEEGPQQRIRALGEPPFFFHDASFWSESALCDHVKAEYCRAFNETAPLLCVHLYRISERESVLLWIMDHLISDGSTYMKLMKEWGELLAERTFTPLPVESEFPDFFSYVDHQDAWLESERGSKQFAYWQHLLSDAPAAEIDTSLAPPSYASCQQRIASFVIPTAQRLQLQRLGVRCGASLFEVTLACYFIFLRRHISQDTFVVGTPMPARSYGPWRATVGNCVNVVPIVAHFDPALTIAELLSDLHASVKDAKRNRHYPLEVLLERLPKLRRSAQRNFIQTQFTFQIDYGLAEIMALAVGTLSGASRGVSFETVAWGGWSATSFPLPISHGDTANLLNLEIMDSDNTLAVFLKYDASRLEESSVGRYIEHLSTILDEMIADDSQKIDCITLLTPDENQMVLNDWNATQADYPRDVCFHQMFEEQVKRTPHVTALIYDDQPLSYDTLNRRANQLAQVLTKLGVASQTRVAICLPRGPDMVTAMLAVLKAGGAYVPIDIGFPADRIEYMLNDCCPQVAIVDSFEWEALVHAAHRLNLHTLGDWQFGPDDNLETPPQAVNGQSYVVYTSGSTGKPKGVIVGQRALVNLLLSFKRLLGMTADDRWLAVTTVAFDIAALELFLPLIVGATVVLANGSWSTDPYRLAEAISRLGITTLQATPVTWRMLLDSGWQSQPKLTALCGGEALDVALAARLHQAVGTLWNVYGPTETTIWSTAHCVDEVDLNGGSLPIGRPVDNTRVYVLNDAGQPLPVGIAGELFIGGDGVAQGYLNQPQLTAERFVKDPFVEGSRLYRTGDRACWRKDGTLEYLGRNDYQVKIRGFRIELGEIEARLRDHPEVRDAAVIAAQTSDGWESLVAYYLSDLVADAQVLRDWVASQLPDYMLPAAWVHMSAWPLTHNGKLDRKALPAPGEDAYALKHYVEPQGCTEMVLAALWSELLGLAQVGRDDDFFALGGQSLLAIRLLSRIRVSLGREVPLSLLFLQPVLAPFARLVEQVPCSVLPVIASADRSMPLVLSFAQQRIWFLTQMEVRTSAAYHMAGGVDLVGALDINALQAALDHIVARHESLRTRFLSINGTPYQQILGPEPFVLCQHDLRQHADVEVLVRRIEQEEAVFPFDLSQGPLIRGQLVRVQEQRHVLLITMHHIVSDGWSLNRFMAELGIFYNAFVEGLVDPLQPLAIQYADYAAWQRHWVQSGVVQGQLAYWREQLADAPLLLELPTDHPRPLVQDYAGGQVSFTLHAPLTTELKALAGRHGCTLYMTLLAGWAILLSRLSGQDDLVIGSPVAGRTRTELEPLIGLFVNTLALRCRVPGSMTVAELLAQVKATTLSAQANQDLPFEQLVEALNPVRSMAHSPLFQTLLVWQNSDGDILELSGLQAEMFASEQVTAQFDLVLTLGERQDVMVGCIEYASSLFNRETATRYVEHLHVLLRAMLHDSSQTVTELALLTANQRHQVLYDWNATDVDYPAAQCVHQLFEAQVERDPQAGALVYESQQLSYDELNRRANRLAHALIAQGVVSGTMVALCLPRGPEMVVAILAVLKAGGAYVPIDPEYPADRIDYILEDSQPLLALLTSTVDERQGWSDVNPDLHVLELGAQHLAYVIYTSGSTGEPKGVMIEHRNLCHQVFALQSTYHLSACDRVLQFAPFTFDMSVEEIFGALCSGATLVLRTQEWISDASTFWQLCQRNAITVTNLPVVFWNTLLREKQACIPDCIRQIMIGGEAVSQAAIEAWYARDGWLPTLFNAYGPTEATVNATVHLIERLNKPGCIGRPLPNTRVYVLDHAAQPVPVGVVGELYIGGAGVARGYLNRAQLTATCFVDDPFVEQPAARMYKTGDRVRWHADGSLEYLGRNDNQVKIRGFRIELGEIEARLRSHAAVTDAVVIAWQEAAQETRLVAYYLAAEAQDASQLRAWVAQQLPDYMLPAAWVHLTAWPLNSNGKLDRRALPVPGAAAFASQGYVAPQGEPETSLAMLWADVLGVERVGRHDNFFTLGGHSLLAVQLIARLKARGLCVDVSRLFTAPTLCEFAQSVTSTAGLPETASPNPLTIPQDSIVPSMLPLIALTQAQIDGIVMTVPGGAKNIQDIYPLTSTQEGILFHHLLSPENDPYVETSVLSFADRSALNRFIEALQSVIARHDILRTAFISQNLDSPVQVVYHHAILPVVECALQAGTRINVEQAPLLHGCVWVDRVDGSLTLHLQTHQLALDHTALDYVIAEIRAILHGEALAQPIPLRNFVVHARREAQRSDHEAFFQHMLQDVTQPTAPFSITAIPAPDHPVQQTQLLLEDGFAASLRMAAQAAGVTVASVFHLAWALVLARTCETDRPVFGTVLLGRMSGAEGIERALGMFINTLPIGLDLQRQTTAQALQQTHQRLAGLLHHEHAPLSLAQRCSGVASPLPLFSTLLNYRHSQYGRVAGLADLVGTGARMLGNTERTHYPFTLNVDDTGQSFLLEVQVCGSVEPQRLAGYLQTALSALNEALEHAPDTPVQALAVLSETEQNTLLTEWNATDVSYPRELCLHQCFEAQVQRTPQATALIHDEQSLSYDQLNRHANQLAHALRALGITSNTRVVICLPRGPQMLMAMLAVLKAGGAYVPIDPGYPAERIDYMLQDCQPQVAIVAGYEGAALDHAARTLDLNAPGDWQAGPEHNLHTEPAAAEALAYVIYTSGSTGKPKGVMVGQRALLNLLLSFKQQLGLTAEHRWLAVTTVAFDIAALELFLPLIVGATVVIAAESWSTDPVRLAREIKRLGITTLQATPVTWRMLLDSGWQGQPELTALSGGEALNVALAARLQPAVGSLWNVYGPTETTIWSTAYRVDNVEAHGAAVAIGRPIANTRVYVLNAHWQPLPIGVAGELYIGGDGVAEGYLNQPDLSAERFIADPFVPGARLYKTGDRARWREDGTLEYLGRNDHQVKVRGFRIELGEIEARLREHPSVRDAVVVAREQHAADVRLVAYYLADQAVDAQTLREWVADQLPDYMLPAAWVHLSAWPLTPNGKLDRNALPAPDEEAYAWQRYAEPQGDTEVTLATLWAEVLGVSRVGRHDHFFALGGHSLLAVQLLARVRAALGRDLALSALFAQPVLAPFARLVEQAAYSALPPITPADRSAPLALSFAQQRLWFLAQLEARASAAYHIAGGVRLIGALNLDALQAALDRIVARHEALRTRFVSINGTPCQQVREATPFALRFYDVGDAADVQGALRDLAREEVATAFELAQDSPIRGRLVRLKDGEYVLLVTVHHIVADGWSLTRLMDELGLLYQAFSHGEQDPLPTLTLQYADFSAWQREWMQGRVFQAQLAYWREQLEDAPPLLELPTDRPRPAQQDYAGDSVEFTLGAGLSLELSALAMRQGVTRYMLMLSGWAILLARLSGQDDIVIGTPVAGRTRTELEPLIGLFVNTLALRCRVPGTATVAELLARVKATTLAAQAHQDVPFEQLVEALNPERNLAHSPLFQTLFLWQEAVDAGLHLQGLTTEPFNLEQPTSQFDLTITLGLRGDRLEGSIGYATRLFDRATVERFVEHWRVLLEAMVLDATQTVARLPLLTEAQRRQVLHDWNATRVDYPTEVCLHTLIEQQVARTPEALALVHDDEALTYSQMNRRANRLAHGLVAHGVGPDVRVAVCMARSLDMVIAVLAILKAGGAYVPIDPSHPAERIRSLLEDSAPCVLIARGDTGLSLPEAPVRLDPQAFEAQPGMPETDPNVHALSANHLAYVIYTSGSTGQPKGVMIEHRAVVNRLLWMQDHYRLAGDDVVLQKTPLGFDVSVWELFWPLMVGVPMVLARHEGQKDPVYLAQLIQQRAITTVHFVPPMLQAFVSSAHASACTSLRRIICSGESLSSALARQTRACLPHAALENLYGPTEAAVDVTAWSVVENASAAGVPIGRPIANTQTYVLDSVGQPVPVGVTGELYLGGVQLARGYLNRPQLTSASFVASTFAPDSSTRLYKTGDQVRWRADGVLEYLGRNDHQVKIRGVRIELGEVQARLRACDAVDDCVVLARQAPSGDTQLVAYYLAAQAQPVDVLHAWMLVQLPDYMVPGAWCHLHAWPLTANGKLDRNALAALEAGNRLHPAYAAPEGDAETTMAELWAHLLGLAQVGRNDHFFALGGHSLLAIQLLAKIRQTQGREVALSALFTQPLLADFAAAVAQAPISALPAIDTQDRSAPLALSFAQQRLWFLARLEARASTAYHIASGLMLSGELHAQALQRALDRIVLRHEALRTRFIEVEGAPRQQIQAPSPFALRLHDLRQCDDAHDTLHQLAREESEAPFDLEQDAPLRGRLILLDEQRQVLLVTLHHIVCDGWSLNCFMQELGVLYRAFVQGDEDPLPALGIQYADYAAWQRQWLQGEVLQSQLAYWREQLADAPPLLELPTDHPRPAVQDYAGGRVDFTLDAALTAALKRLAARHDSTLYMTLLAGWAILLSRLSGQDDLVIGSPVAGRTRTELEPLIGLFVNTLALRCRVPGTATVAELLAQVKATTLAAQAHQDLPFEQLVEALNPARSLAHSPLFQTLFAWQNADSDTLHLTGLQAHMFTSEQVTAQFDLALTLGEYQDEVSGCIEYASSLFEHETAARYVEHWQVLLKAKVLDATQTLTRLPLLTEAQRKQVLHDWNPSAVDYPREALVHQLVERHAAQSPDAIALVHEDQHLSYAQLNRRANQLAHALIAQGVLPDARVAVCLPRGMEMVIALLAVLKAGGAYVPIDPDYPLERIDYLLDDSQPQLLITRTALPSALPVLDLDAAEDGAPWPDVNPDPRFLGLDAQHLAYVIYTSGSTGKPKGVMIEHRHVCHQVFALQSTYHLSARDRVLQFAPFTFDMSVEEIFGALCSGAALVLRTPAWISDASTFWHLCQRNAITVANLPVVFWNTLLREKQACIPDCIRQIMIGGEAVSQAAIEVWYARDGWLPALFNAYGPTEATVNATVHLIERVNTPGCIGRPLPNTRVYVLDHAAQPVPVGVIGELYIGGAGVARGYLNRAQLTATCFVDDPFAEQPAARMYKTGDRVRWHADGSLEYLGRNDNQVKIRGFRIELGEIEARLRSHAAVTDAVVSAWQEAAQETRLVAYYLAAEAQDTSQLRAWVAQQLPDYMLPAAWVHLTAWPLNSNGKLDRRALPAPGAAAFASQGYVAPQGEPETTLAMLWADVLGVERVGRHDNFFTLGGHSLLAVQLVSRIRQMMGRAVSLSALFAQPLLADFATVVEQAPLGSLPPITPVNRAAPLALSFSQQRLWFLSQLQASASAAYHIAGGVKINGQLNRPALQAALDRIVARHEALRTGFTSLNGTPFQHIHEPAAFALAVHDLRHQPDVEGALQHLSALEAAAPFDLEQGPLIRGQLVQVGECEHVLLITLHHIASDGWSLVRFLRELGALYDAFCTGQSDPLPPLPLQYVDYAAWQRRWIDGAVLQGQLTYWREQLSDAPPLLTLPADRPRPAVQEYTGGRVDFSLDTALTAELKALAARHDVTLYMTLLAAWAALLARLSGQEDIVIGSPVAGRTRTELEPLIGFFVNTLALRCRVNGSETLAALLAQVKATTLAALAHQDLPFEQLVEALNPQRSLAHSPLFQTLFAWQEAGGDGLTLPGLQTQPLNVGQVTAKFDLLLALEDDGEQLQGSIEYASSLFDQSTVERYAEHLQILLGAMVRDASQPLASLPVLSDAQRRHVLYDWNTTAADYPRAQAIHHLFEAQVARTPQAVALLDDDQQLSYDALNQHANVLAHTLLSSGVGPGERVAVCLPRGVQSIVAILAVLKAGGAYLPIDPAYPDERLRYMLQDGQPRVVLTDAALAARVPSSSAGVRLILTDSLPPLPASPPASNPATAFTAQQLAYVIYTSGSTGQPKGVCMPHRALVNLMHWQQRTQTTPGGLRTLQYAALGFDVSFQEIFSTLLSGGELVLISEAERLDMAMLGELLRRRRIQRLYLPYVALKALADQVRADRQPIDDLQQIITAGEQVVITETIRQVFADQLAHVRLHNHYGPTETHVVSAFELPACAHHWPRLPSIGRPVANARVYVLDALQQPVPVGVGGELYLAGDAVACGYFNQPDLTLERFLPDPFSAASDQPAPMMYRSGDLGCWQADGTLAYLGRADRQVKVRGFRVELEEIEAQLNTVAGISQAVVLLREDDPQSQRLVAYLLVDEAMRDACDPQTLRSYLSNRLPEYMVPAAYVPLSHFPISPNGKLDRDALPMPDAGAYASQAYEPPQGEIEPLLAALWCSLLNVEQVGRQDHFFALGGHSLLAVQLISRIKNQLMVEIRLQDVFAAPQLHRMADLLVQRIDLQLKELMSQDDSLDRR